MSRRKVHRRESEFGEYGVELSYWPACFSGETDPWFPHDIRTTRKWDEVTCLRCLKRRPASKGEQ